MHPLHWNPLGVSHLRLHASSGLHVSHTYLSSIRFEVKHFLQIVSPHPEHSHAYRESMSTAQMVHEDNTLSRFIFFT